MASQGIFEGIRTPVRTHVRGPGTYEGLHKKKIKGHGCFFFSTSSSPFFLFLHFFSSFQALQRFIKVVFLIGFLIQTRICDLRDEGKLLI